VDRITPAVGRKSHGYCSRMDASEGSAASALSERGQRAAPSSSSPPQRAQKRARKRVRAALAWTAGAAALFALCLRIKLSMAPDSDTANNALQAWDMLHGHLMLHGWLTSDVSFYTFELPLMAVVEIFFGLHNVAMHVSMALIYLIIAGCGVAIAVPDSRGAARAARAGVVVAVLTAPVLTVTEAWIPLGFPDHFGTAVFLLVSCLLIDSPSRFTAPLLCVILVAGQIGDVTVRYVAVPAIIVMCVYQVLATRRIKTRDTANLVAVALSLPLATWVRALMRHFGSYLMAAPKTRIAPVSQWANNWALTWHSVRMLFGITGEPGAAPVGKTAIFGWACLAVAAAGALRAIWHWRRARRSEQVLLLAIVANVVVYAFSTLPTSADPHDLAGLLPAGAILGARALVPDRIAGRLTALVVACAALIAALLPLSLQAAARAPQATPVAALTAWLQAHGLRYGLGGYWDSSVVSLQSGGQVLVRAVGEVDGQITPDAWEVNFLWYDPARHYANFVIFNVSGGDLGTDAMRFFGAPVSVTHVGSWDVAVYDANLLQDVGAPVLPPTS
jgi:hypothetical protein